ncbi:MAG TPA: serine/threonine-protein kinase, partial [Blastocatellia bacterium]|nr:serine/threonine-protein kinase [Blastocatellia bacterium]
MKRCPACQKEFADKVMHCVYDGSKLQPVPAPAGTLSYLISSAAPLPVKSALRIAISLCDALEAIHRAGRVVGALRPRNIFVANYPPVDGHPPVVQIEEKATADKAHRIEGATAYLAPEVKRAQAADVRSDVYSVGAILREMLYGQFGRNLAERARPTIPAALLEIIERATHENPSARHDSIAALEVELQAALQRFERAAASPAAAKPKTRFEGRDTDSLLGQIIAGRYRLLAKLGQSSMGTVFKSESATLNRPVAINVFPAELSQDAAFVARFQSEAQAATRVKHPHVAAIHDFGITRDGYAYLVSELVEGESLHDVLEREGPLPPSRAMDILRQTAEAVDAMHKVKATHRSLKPSRIMLKRVDRRADYVKVLGFSMFRMMPRVTASNLTPAGVVIAAPEYMAPEQLAGEAVDARYDIYSLAVIFHEMLTGRLPFEGNSMQVRAVRQMMGEPTPLRAVLPRAGRRVEAVVMKGLARRPEDRYATVMDFMRALEAAGRAEAMDHLD